MIVAGLYFNLSLTPDRIILLIAIAALGTGRVRLFLKDWSLFIVVLLAWQVLTGMSRHFGNFRPHVSEMIDFDRFFFFGHVPTIWLQSHFHQSGHFAVYDMAAQGRFYVNGPLRWYDVVATVLYLMHFVFPMIVAFALWLWKRPVFLEFMGSFLLVALAGFCTFVFFPAAPPWIAANWYHYLPHVDRILQSGILFFGGQQSFSALYQWLWDHGGWDLYGAVPSEHAAFPFLCFLYARQAWPRAGWLLLIYCVAVWVAVVYMGEHYVADVVVGVIYAALGYALVQLTKRFNASEATTSTLESTEGAAPDSAVSKSLTA